MSKRRWGLISDQASIEEIYIDGALVEQLPSDLYIPPRAMRVLLDSFSGPLDLLLYLIRKQNLDILNIPILKITEQYLHYIELIEAQNLELAADYLLMAATLAEIKSRMLLPILPSDEENEEDPRMALVRQLQQYEKIKEAAQALTTLPCLESDFHSACIKGEGLNDCVIYPHLELSMLKTVMEAVIVRLSHSVSHQIEQEPMSVSDRMISVMDKINVYKSLSFSHLFSHAEGRQGLVVSMLAILELAKLGSIILEQEHAYAPITIRAKI